MQIDQNASVPILRNLLKQGPFHQQEVRRYRALQVNQLLLCLLQVYQPDVLLLEMLHNLEQNRSPLPLLRQRGHLPRQFRAKLEPPAPKKVF